ncbi:MAG: nitrate- and nitrite sensing domain-containing protein [Breoghania sp.]|nr:nitrate- and nitrite sensing domain-containing protein [Breoghania sp.]
MIPTIGLLIIGAMILFTDLEKVRQERSIVAVIDRAPAISLFVHELQKERGTSADFIDSKGGQFADDLKAQRAETDEALAKFNAAIPEATGVLTKPVFAEPFKRSREDLQKFSQIRTDVSNLKLTVGEMASYYAKTISDLLAMVEAVATLADDVHLVRDGGGARECAFHRHEFHSTFAGV